VNLAAQRLHNQRLVGTPFKTPAAAVQWLGAVQAQDFSGAKWALALRTRSTNDAALDRAFNSGAFFRTHVMRPTWHLMAPADLRWLLALTSPRVHAVNGHMYRRLELDEAMVRRAYETFVAGLQGGRAKTRQELAACLEAKGIAARGQRLAYIVMHAELSGLVCSGPLRGKQHTYALLEERVPPAPALTREEALGTLARRYFRSHGPATVADFAWWSGLTVADAKAGLSLIESEVAPIVLGEKKYWAAAPMAGITLDNPVVHLLPNYDELVVAYRDHGPSLDPAARETLRSRTDGPLDVHLVARDGLVVGGWRKAIEKGVTWVAVDPLVKLRRVEQARLKHAASDYSTFIGMPVSLKTRVSEEGRWL
jgi:hypothetical protein